MATQINQQKIRTIVSQLNKVIQFAYCRLQAIRQLCKHPNATKTYGSNVGNYDPSCDCWWIDYKCPDCGKIWTENQ